MADELKASPQEPITGALAKALGWMAHPTVDGHEIKPHLNLPSLLLPLESGAKFFENRSYGKPYTTGAGGLGGTQNLAPDVRDFAMDVAPYAPDVARLAGKGAKAIGKGVGEAMSQFAPSGSGPKTLASQVGAIKPKGGNWLTGNVEKSLEDLKTNKTAHKQLEEMRQVYPPEEMIRMSPETRATVERAFPHLENQVALNNWVDKNLTNYVKKEMGTPEDPVRKLAEEGILHSPMEAGRYRVPENIKQARFNAGFPTEGMGQSDLAKAWEHLSDASIKPYQVRGLLNAQNSTNRIPKVDQIFEQNPWLSKLNPEEVVHETRHPFNNLGFDHILDVLKEDVASGRLRPESLKNVSMEQAVRRTHEYDQEMAKKMEDARAKNLESMTVHKEYPEGYKWVQLDKPGQFAAESDAMGHSVRGYEPPEGHPDWIPESGDSGSEYYGHGGWEAIKSGKAKVYSLVDPKGNPHTTVEVKANQNPYPVSGEAFAMLPQSTKAQYGQYVREWRQRNPHIEDLTDEHTTQALKEAGVPPQPDSITQIKGKGNAKPVDTYIPYVQDFVKSGNWSDVGDLHNTDLTKIYPESDLAKSLAQKGISVPSYTTSEELTNLLKQAEVGSYRDASKGKTWINDEHPDYRNDVPPVEATPNIPPPETPQFKRGGKVHITDNLDTQWAELQFQRK